MLSHKALELILWTYTNAPLAVPVSHAGEVPAILAWARAAFDATAATAPPLDQQPGASPKG